MNNTNLLTINAPVHDSSDGQTIASGVVCIFDAQLQGIQSFGQLLTAKELPVSLRFFKSNILLNNGAAPFMPTSDENNLKARLSLTIPVTPENATTMNFAAVKAAVVAYLESIYGEGKIVG